MVNRRILLKGGLAGGLALSLSGPARLLAEAPADPYLALVHPELRDLVTAMQGFMKTRPPLTRASIAATRKPVAGFEQQPLTTVPYEQRAIPVGHGHPDVTIYIVNAKPGANRPAILHTHGGGFIGGSAKSSVRALQAICEKLDCVAVSVEYRLAPETTYAGSIEDNYAGLKWLHGHATELGADPARIAVMGESAGGGHAALLAIAARDRGEVPLCFQCLIYPMLDDRTASSRKMPDHVGRLGWSAGDNRLGWECFLGMAPGGRRSPVAGVPARNPNLAGLPPAFIGVGSIDLFCDEDIDYAQRLNDAGVPTELVVVPGGFHGFDAIALLTKKPLGTWFENTKLNALRRGFGMPAV